MSTTARTDILFSQNTLSASAGGDKYKEIAAFLDKAAAAKTDMAVDRVDRVVSFNGHGYNGDCLIAWMDEEKAYKEHFPEAFTSATGFKHWNFRMLEPMKHRIFSELERPGIDLFMFHEHGAPTTQYINGFGEADKFDDRVRHFRQDIYSRVRRAISKGNPRDEVIDAFAKEFNLTSTFSLILIIRISLPVIRRRSRLRIFMPKSFMIV